MSLIDQALQKAYQQRLRPVTPDPQSLGFADVPREVARGFSAHGNSPVRELYVHAAEPMPRRHFGDAARENDRLGESTGEARPRTASPRPGDANAEAAAFRIPVSPEVCPEASSVLAADSRLQRFTHQVPAAERFVTTVERDADLALPAKDLEWMPFPVAEVSASRATVAEASEPVAPLESPLVEFKPTWEVDAFQFPAPVVQAEERLLARLREALAELLATQTQVVWVSSLAEKEGRTTIAMLLALSLAKMGRQVLLMQGDVAAASLAKQLGVACELGWSGQTNSSTSLADECLYSLADHLTLLPAAGQGFAAGDAAGSTLTGTLARLVPSFHVIVVDAAVGMSHRNLVVPDAKELEVVVQDVRRTTSESLQRALWAVPMAKYREVRVVQNFV